MSVQIACRLLVSLRSFTDNHVILSRELEQLVQSVVAHSTSSQTSQTSQASQSVQLSQPDMPGDLHFQAATISEPPTAGPSTNPENMDEIDSDSVEDEPMITDPIDMAPSRFESGERGRLPGQLFAGFTEASSFVKDFASFMSASEKNDFSASVPGDPPVASSQEVVEAMLRMESSRS